MAEFFDVMVEMRRMHDDYDDCDGGCPLSDKGFYKKPYCEIDEEDIKEAEKIIMEWSKEHPVVYPTWGEFFKIADLEDARLIDPVRVDIAKKLGLEPVRRKSSGKSCREQT